MDLGVRELLPNDGGKVEVLTAAGVSEVQHVDDCTSCSPDLYFSHRRDDGVTGRQAGIIVRDGS